MLMYYFNFEKFRCGFNSIFNINESMNISMNKGQQIYLKWNRENIFKTEQYHSSKEGYIVRVELLIKISEVLIQYAKRQDVIEYGQLCKEIGLEDVQPIVLKDPLGEISVRCIELGYPPLSAIVVNKETRLPGDGLFTYIAPKMGYSNLTYTQYEDFYEQQKRSVFGFNSWQLFLTTFSMSKRSNGDVRFPDLKIQNIDLQPTQSDKKFNDDDFQKELKSRSYIIGGETLYHIITVKRFLDTQQQGPFRYQILLFKNHRLVKKITIKHETSKKLLTHAKKRGIKLLFEHSSTIKFEEVSMVHYKQDRPKEDPWDKEPLKSFSILFSTYGEKYIEHIVINDIDAEIAQEDTYYRDGEAKHYHGTRYERNPKNRSEAIRIHGTICKVCDFNFEEVYGERGKDFIEVHHIKPLSTINKEVIIDPRGDLVPVCSNCHRMIHRRKDDVLTVNELKTLMNKMKAEYNLRE
ncbi:HNH endonuclease [Bacillus toyonensis]|uniref:HNH endonuclease n=1 Tax=Bacillus toyonensis TaxID=155322 RepID=UPI0020D27192|nr:HNH endonuclease [Bacillus toyonensis]